MNKMVVMIAALAACGPKGAPSSEIAPASTAGAPAAGASDPVASSEMPPQTGCSLEIARECSDGLLDGCLAGKTLEHVCIAPDAEDAPPCEQEIQRECPEGQIDACASDPPLARTHLCVVR